MGYQKTGSGFIYALTFPNGKLYVGQTRWPLTLRFSNHRRDSLKKNRNSALYNAWRKHGAPVISLLDECALEVISEREQHWIIKLNTRVPYGYNITAGGEGAFMAESTKELLRIAHTGKKLTDEHKEKLRAAHTGKALSQEHRAKIGKANSGKKRSAETRAKMTAAQRSVSPEKRAAIVAIMHAALQTDRENINNRISDAKRGTKASAETKEKLRAVRLKLFSDQKFRDRIVGAMRAGTVKKTENSPRQIALRNGERYYFNGIACLFGHTAMRRAACGTCVDCYRASAKRRKAAKRAELRRHRY